VQREIEAWGIPTISLSNNPVATGRVMPPRWARVRFPRGSMLGEPGNHGKQLAVLRDTLAALASITTPGGHVELPYRWESSPIMWRGKPLSEGPHS
jgi:hypothetical protein